MDAWIQPWRQKDHESWVISIVKIAEFKDLTLRLPMAEHRFTHEKVGAESRSQNEKGCTFYPLHPGSMNQPFKTFQKKWIGLTRIHQKRNFSLALGPLSSSNQVVFVWLTFVVNTMKNRLRCSPKELHGRWRLGKSLKFQRVQEVWKRPRISPK